MKAIFTRTVTALFLFFSASAAIAQTPAPTDQLSRDAAPFPNFFQSGQENLEREIQLLYKRQNALSASSEALAEAPLKIKVNPQAELDRLPQIEPSDFQSQPE
jgi:hypothetical protein